MAGKKLTSITDELARFKDIILKNGFGSIRYQNHTMYADSPKGGLIIHVEDVLWNAIIEDAEIKSMMKELITTDKTDRLIIEKLTYCDNAAENWVDIDAMKIYDGSIINISIEDFQYQIPINKNLFLIKFKKSDAVDFSYQLITSPRLSLILRKEFKSKIPGANWTIFRIFQVL